VKKFLKELLTLAEELNKAKGFEVLVVINEMELLYTKHIESLNVQHEPDLEYFAMKSGTPHVIAEKYAAIKTRSVSSMLSAEYKVGYVEGITHFIEDNIQKV
jgi:DNA integrity scanning protein DisA with diadenylate cyclase activity